LLADDSKLVDILKKGLEEFGFVVQSMKHSIDENGVSLGDTCDLIIVDEVTETIPTQADYYNKFFE
jgi:hypothetical protein